MTALSIHFLGDFHIANGEGSPLFVASERLRSLLVYLALHRNAPQPRQQIAFLFWSESTEAQAQANLRRELSKLRRVQPAIALLLRIERQTLEWRGDSQVSLDVAQFEDALAAAHTAQSAARSAARTLDERDALQAAVALYSGPLFPDAYDDWILVHRERLNQQFVQALERLIVLHEDALAYDAAIAAAQKLMRHDTLREETVRQLMRLYALNGERSEALRVYHNCARSLMRELGVEPDFETEAIYQRLLQGPGTQERQTPSPEQHISRSQLIGRRDEWRELLTVWRQANTRGPHLLLISGEAGMGKSRLAEELYEWVRRQGLAAAHSRAYAAEGDLAYAPLVEWLRSDSLRPTLAHLDTAWLTEVARLLPELLTECDGLHPPEPLTESWQRRRLMEGLARACIVDQHPRLLWLDDLQWCDEEMLAWLGFFLRFDAAAPVLIVGTVRPQEIDVDHPLHQLMRSVRPQGRLIQVALGPLDAPDVALLAAQELGRALEGPEADRLFAETAGNPLFVVESVRAGLETLAVGREMETSISPLPPKVYDVIRSRLDRLSSPARMLAELAAVIGRAFTYKTLTGASRMPENDLVAALDELWRRGIIREQGLDAYDFSHDRIRDVAYAGISPVRRPHLHRQVAVALEGLHADDLSAVAARLAVHNAQGGNLDAAISFYQQAAALAASRLANTEAFSLLRSALKLLNELPQTGERQQVKLTMLLDLIELLPITQGWRPTEMLPRCTEALQLARTVGSPRQLYLALSQLKTYFGMRGQHREELVYAQEALAVINDMDDDPLSPMIATAHNMVAVAYLRLGELTAAHEHYLPGSSEQATGFYSRVLALWLLGYADQSRRKIAEYLVRSEQIPYHRAIVLTHSLQVSYCMRAVAPIHEQAALLSALANQYEMSFWQAAAALFQGWSAVHAGDMQAGISQMVDGIQGMETAGAGVLTLFLSPLAEAYQMAGCFTEAQAILDRAFARAHDGSERFWYAELQRMQGALLLAQGHSAREVESWYFKALATAHVQGAKPLELRAAISLSHLWQEQDCKQDCKQDWKQEIHDLLSPIYAWFSEGFDTADLVEARALLRP